MQGFSKCSVCLSVIRVGLGKEPQNRLRLWIKLYRSLHKPLFAFCCCFWDIVSLCSVPCPGTHYVDQAGFELIVINLPLPLSARIKDMQHHSQPNLLLWQGMSLLFRISQNNVHSESVSRGNKIVFFFFPLMHSFFDKRKTNNISLQYCSKVYPQWGMIFPSSKGFRDSRQSQVWAFFVVRIQGSLSFVCPGIFCL